MSRTTDIFSANITQRGFIFNRQVKLDFFITMSTVSGYITLVTLAPGEYLNVIQATDTTPLGQTGGQTGVVQVMDYNADNGGVPPIGALIIESVNSGNGGRTMSPTYNSVATARSPGIEFYNSTNANKTIYISLTSTVGNNHFCSVLASVYTII